MDVSQQQQGISGRWRDFFGRWPKDMARRGVVVTSFGEQIPFEGFLTRQDLLLLDRHAPDTVGARMVVLEYEQILALKITDVVRPKVFEALEFEGSLPRS